MKSYKNISKVTLLIGNKTVKPNEIVTFSDEELIPSLINQLYALASQNYITEYIGETKTESAEKDSNIQEGSTSLEGKKRSRKSEKPEE